MYRLLGIAVAVCSQALFTGCKPQVPPDPTGQQAVEIDSLAPVSPLDRDVATKCNEIAFDENAASGPVQVPNAPKGVIVRIVPAKGSHRFKLRHLAKGKIIARLDNQGDVDFSGLALYGKSGERGRSCWFVWEDEDGEGFRSKFVSYDGQFAARDAYFKLDLHPARHEREASDWRPDSVVSALPAVNPFALASMDLNDREAQFVRGPWMWTTCLINGCCRSRQ